MPAPDERAESHAPRVVPPTLRLRIEEPGKPTTPARPLLPAKRPMVSQPRMVQPPAATPPAVYADEMSDTNSSFRVHALPPDFLVRLRSTRLDASGNRVENLSAQGREPLRCCLRYADPGEAILLFGYEPPIGKSPYREIGAVFAHAEACAGPAADGYPEEWRGKPQVLRSYDARGWIRDAVMHDGTDPEREIARLLSDPEAVQLHSRNVAYGCFMFVVTRKGA